MSDTPLEDHEDKFGGRKKKHLRHTKKHKNVQKNMIVVGKVYADWCGHCQSLKPEWAKMKNKIHKKKGKHTIVYEEIEEKEIEEKLKQIQNKQQVSVEANGYPTLFRISNGKVDYYNGNRESDAMADWYLKGGDPVEQPPMYNLLPNLMQDQQGGIRNRIQRRSRHHGKQYSKFYNGHNGTRKHTEKKPNRMFNFLFGK